MSGHDVSRLWEDVNGYINSLGNLNAYQKALASLALDLSSSMATAMAAAPVAKTLMETLDKLTESVGADKKKISKIDELAAKRRSRSA